RILRAAALVYLLPLAALLLFSCVKEPIHVQSVKVSPESAELSEGEHLRLSVTVSPSDAADKSVVWSSSDNGVAMVDASGEVVALKAGSAVIKATANDNGVNGSCNVTVKAKEVPAESIKLSESSISLVVGDEKQLSAEVRPDNATNKDVVWTSADESIAKVSSSGKVTAVAAGETTVKAASASQPSVKAECKVAVSEKVIPVTSITLDKQKMELTKGLDYTLHATVEPANATNKELVWASSNEDIVVVNQQGKVIAFSTGTASVTATSVSNPEVSASCEFTVVSEVVSVTGVSIVYNTTTLYIPDPLKLQVRIYPENATDQNVTWTSGNTAIATVSADGTVTPVSAGEVNIMVTTRDGGKTDLVTLVVCDTRITDFTFAEHSDTPIIVKGGSTFKLTPIITPDYASNKKVKWESNNSTVASVSNGIVTFAMVNGQVTISACTEISSLYCSQVFEVQVMPNEVNLPDGLVVPVGIAVPANAVVSPDNTFDKSLEYIVGDPSLATVDAEGMITGLKVGKTTLTVKCIADPSVTDTKDLEVVSTNKLSINGEAAVTYDMGKLDELFSGYTASGTEVTSLKWTEPSLMNATDVMALRQVKETLANADMALVSFVDDGTTYEGYSSKQERIKPLMLPQMILSGFKKMETVVVPTSVNSIGSLAFQSCTSMTSCKLPAGLKTMWRYCFSNCAALESIEIPEGFEEFKEDSNFQSCYSLKSFRFPDSCYKVGHQTLTSCPSLESIHIGKSATKSVRNVYFMSYGLKTITLSEGNSELKIVNGNLVSSDNTELLLMPTYSPDGILRIPGYKEIYFCLIGYPPTYNVPYTKVIYEEGVSVITGIFRGSDALESIDYPSTTTSIGITIDKNCMSLKSVTCRAATPPELKSVAMDGMDNVKEILVPSSSVSAYKAAENWSRYAGIISALP
ncbi:MAG: Ig-like domain-containing protein, partial [Bacteroidales bacterium]|nr:Ig-like domain-containing protein [Bacteroidales bacterium]